MDFPLKPFYCFSYKLFHSKLEAPTTVIPLWWWQRWPFPQCLNQVTTAFLPSNSGRLTVALPPVNTTYIRQWSWRSFPTSKYTLYPNNQVKRYNLAKKTRVAVGALLPQRSTLLITPTTIMFISPLLRYCDNTLIKQRYTSGTNNRRTVAVNPHTTGKATSPALLQSQTAFQAHDTRYHTTS